MRTKIFLLVIFVMLPQFTLTNTQPPVYLTFTTHNEDGEPWNIFNYYWLRRNFIVQLADSVISRGAKWNFQSDWKFLQAVNNFDTGSIVLNTNGKNLIKWLIEDKGIDCDPHSHEAHGYNYADVAYLHSQLGITPSKITGGFLYDTVINNNNWENLENGIYGRVYTSYFWKPDILWGGGTQNHLNDPQNYGVWKPQNMKNYYVHDSTKHLTVIGNGCNNKIFDTTEVTTVVGRIRNVVNAITYHAFPDSGFYTATMHTQVGQLNTSQINKVVRFIDSMNVFVNNGTVVWKNLDEIYSIWNDQYNKKPFRTSCADLPSAYTNYNIKLCVEGLYNEMTDRSSLSDTVSVFLRNVNAPFSIVDSAETTCDSVNQNSGFIFFRASSGVYYINVVHRNSIETWSKYGGEIFIPGSTLNYNFTSLLSQAYGYNMKLKGSRYCIFSGDADRNGAVNLNDIALVHNSAADFIGGYVNEDINGDMTVNLSDLLIAFNNSSTLVSAVTP